MDNLGMTEIEDYTRLIPRPWMQENSPGESRVNFFIL
jgi:hypothetical protein